MCHAALLFPWVILFPTHSSSSLKYGFSLNYISAATWAIVSSSVVSALSHTANWSQSATMGEKYIHSISLIGSGRNQSIRWEQNSVPHTPSLLCLLAPWLLLAQRDCWHYSGLDSRNFLIYLNIHKSQYVQNQDHKGFHSSPTGATCMSSHIYKHKLAHRHLYLVSSLNQSAADMSGAQKRHAAEGIAGMGEWGGD